MIIKKNKQAYPYKTTLFFNVHKERYFVLLKR